VRGSNAQSLRFVYCQMVRCWLQVPMNLAILDNMRTVRIQRVLVRCKVEIDRINRVFVSIFTGGSSTVKYF